MSKAEVNDVHNQNQELTLYKFRPLSNDEDYNQLKAILETGEFWCSKFSEFNDQLEGAFETFSPEEIEEIHSGKQRYKICSFSSENAFSNPLMWGYYANGFKGVALKVRVEMSEMKKVTYVENIPDLKQLNGNNDEKVKTVLTTKLKPWEHECEYRFLKVSDKTKFKIGKITAVYFGDPYGYAFEKNNSDKIYENSESLKRYKKARKNMIKYIEHINKDKKPELLECYFVQMDGCKVVGKKAANNERS